MIVVSNTSPLTNLAQIGRFNLLQDLYDHIHIAEGVWLELNAQNKVWPGSKEVSNANWISQHTVKNQALVTALEQDLDRGEAETIALAIELNADLVLLDEKIGRKLAQRHGLKVAGILGMLVEAKSKQIIPAIKPELDSLTTEAGFFINPALRADILDLANELGDS